MSEIEKLKVKIEELEKKNKRLISFVELIRDFFFYDSSGSGKYLKGQAQNALNDVGVPSEVWRGYDGREVKSH